jgi:hypothetical protein
MLFISFWSVNANPCRLLTVVALIDAGFGLAALVIHAVCRRQSFAFTLRILERIYKSLF